VLVGGVLGHLALRRSAKGARVSGAGLSLTAMLFGAVIYMGLAFASGMLWAAAQKAAGV
jgi:hypothetical protein